MAEPIPTGSPVDPEIVQLYQFPRTQCVPSISPWCIKVETWLRIAGIPYQNHMSWTKRSKKEQVPFIEYQGLHVADSTFIILELSRTYGIDLESSLSDEERATAQAFEGYLSESLIWPGLYERTKVMQDVFGEKMQGKGLPSMPARMRPVRKIIAWSVTRMWWKRLKAQGMGRNSLEEAQVLGKRVLEAVNIYLASREYFAGLKPTRFDATAFGILAEFAFSTVDSKLGDYIHSDCPNIIRYLQKIKTEFWPDWEEATREFQPDTKWMKDRNDTLKNAKQLPNK